jgi:hypothetical protein
MGVVAMIEKLSTFNVNRTISAKEFYRSEWEKLWRRSDTNIKRLHDNRFFLNDSFLADGDYIVKFSDDSNYIRLSKKDFLALTSHQKVEK